MNRDCTGRLWTDARISPLVRCLLAGSTQVGSVALLLFAGTHPTCSP
jgi:hypothetical protein